MLPKLYVVTIDELLGVFHRGLGKQGRHCAPGAIVFVPAERQSDGSLHAGAVLFGKDGVIPPM